MQANVYLTLATRFPALWILLASHNSLQLMECPRNWLGALATRLPPDDLVLAALVSLSCQRGVLSCLTALSTSDYSCKETHAIDCVI